jgi:hypothetical protein
MTIQPLHRSTPSAERSRELELPPGQWHGRLWVSDAPLAEPAQYLRCVAEFERTGLWPVLIPRDERFAANNEDWIDDRGRLAPAELKVPMVDPVAALARWWDPSCCEGSCLRPFNSKFPGLTRRPQRRSDPLAEAGNTGSVLAAHGEYRLGLVQTERPADIPAILGWTGMIKFTNQVAELSAVLRSWEERFGATLIVLGYDALELSVSAPPRDQGRALVAAAEHRAFSLPTYAGQPGNLRAYASDLIHRRHWKFSWA